MRGTEPDATFKRVLVSFKVTLLVLYRSKTAFPKSDNPDPASNWAGNSIPGILTVKNGAHEGIKP